MSAEHCPNHFLLVNQVNQIVDDSKRLREDTIQFQQRQEQWTRELKDSMNQFMDGIDQEIRGGKGPEGRPGIKQIIHDNKANIAEIRTQIGKREINWQAIIIQTAAGILATIASAIILYFILRGQIAP